MSLDAVIAVHIMLIAKLLIMFSSTKSFSLTSSLMCLAAVKVVILCNAKLLVRLKIFLTILGNLFAD